MVTPDPKRIHSFEGARAFEAWLRKHHGSEPEIYLRIYKAGSGVVGIKIAEALDVALCWGWIDGLRKALDAQSYLQRYSPRRAQSPWSQINRDHVARLTAAGRMAEPGLHEVERAKADGRWQRAYAPGRETEVPADLLAAIRKSKPALRTFETLNRHNQFALAFRLGQLKTEAARSRRIAAYVEMLARGEVIHPQPAARKKRGPADDG